MQIIAIINQEDIGASFSLNKKVPRINEMGKLWNTIPNKYGEATSVILANGIPSKNA